jgi:methenyltetrahydrofolate cyclohydrolase
MMSAAAAAPMELPSAAGLARLAGELALSGSERRSDAATAALLAAAVASSAAIFVADDLRGSPADPRVGQARAAASAAAAIAGQCTSACAELTPERRSR